MIHDDCLHELDVVEMALRAHALGRLPELVAERPRECFVRAVTGFQGQRQNVRRA